MRVRRCCAPRGLSPSHPDSSIPLSRRRGRCREALWSELAGAERCIADEIDDAIDDWFTHVWRVPCRKALWQWPNGRDVKILLNLLRRVIALSAMVPLFIHYGQTLYSR